MLVNGFSNVIKIMAVVSGEQVITTHTHDILLLFVVGYNMYLAQIVFFLSFFFSYLFYENVTT